MKISSASKKVLASALSAAMVVAFAPTVAFGAVATGTGDNVTINFDADGGEASQATLTGFKQGGTFVLPTATKNGYTATSWWCDFDNDGVRESGEYGAAGNEFTIPDTAAASITFKAEYNSPKFSDAGIVFDASAKTLTVTVANSTTKVAKHDYTVTVKNPAGTVVGKKVFKAETTGSHDATIADGGIAVQFQANPNSDANTDDVQLVANTRDLVSGEYTAEIADGSTVISTAKTKLLKLTQIDETADPATTTSELIQANAQGAATKSSLTGNWLDEAGYATGDSYTFTADATITKKAGVQYATGGTYNPSTRVVSFTVSDSASAKDDTYAVAVKDPSGATVYSAVLTAAGANLSQALAFTFDQASVTNQKAEGGATEKAGVYDISVTKTVKRTGETSSSKAKATLTEVKVDAGEGSFKKAVTADKKDFFVDGSTTTAPSAKALTDSDLEEVAGKTFDKWVMNGKAFTYNSTALKAGEVNTVTATYKAADAAAAKPTLVSATKDLQAGSTSTYEYNVKLASATSGAKIYYTAGASAADPTDSSSAYSNKITVSTSDAETAGYVIKAKAFAVSGSVDPSIADKHSAVVTIASLVDDQKAWKSFKQGASSKLEDLVGKSADLKWMNVDAVKAAVDAGQAAIDAAGYFTTDEKGAAATYTAQYKAVYEAVLATANAELAKYADEAPVAVGTKAYKMTAANYKAAKKTVDDQAKAITVAEANKDNSIDYKDAAEAIINAIDNATYTEDKTIKAEDITAAAAVTAQLKAAKTGAEAKAALEAYAALSDAAKKLVASADVAAVQEIATKAALVDSQDLAAARDLNGKKVTAKAKVGKKAQGKSFTYKLAASESGATASYAKVSGSKYIKISSTGKVTFSKVKVAKKAKTYKAKVSVTYGTQTVTKTVQLVVKKK